MNMGAFRKNGEHPYFLNGLFLLVYLLELFPCDHIHIAAAVTADSEVIAHIFRHIVFLVPQRIQLYALRKLGSVYFCAVLGKTAFCIGQKLYFKYKPHGTSTGELLYVPIIKL